MRSALVLGARRFAVVTLIICSVGLLSSATSDAETVTERQAVIVVLNDLVVSPEAVALRHSEDYGVTVRVVYTHALKGYAGEATPEALALLLADPDVDLVEPDQVMHID